MPKYPPSGHFSDQMLITFKTLTCNGTRSETVLVFWPTILESQRVHLGVIDRFFQGCYWSQLLEIKDREWIHFGSENKKSHFKNNNQRWNVTKYNLLKVRYLTEGGRGCIFLSKTDQIQESRNCVGFSFLLQQAQRLSLTTYFLTVLIYFHTVSSLKEPESIVSHDRT